MQGDIIAYESRIQELEKANRTLEKKLERAKAELVELESTNEKTQSLLRKAIDEAKQREKQLQATQAQMLHAEKMSSLGHLVAGIAHEINNPVNFIHGNITYTSEYTQQLLELIQVYQNELSNSSQVITNKLEEIDFDFIREDLPKLLVSMQVGTERIREIVKSLRTFSRLDEADIKSANIHEGIDSTLMILQNRIKDKPKRVSIEVVKDYGDIPDIECYPGQLNQVFMNILVNAIDALEDGIANKQVETPVIKISTYKLNASWVQIVIADNGCGIPENIKQYIFDPFFTTKPVGKGTGMGMSISYQIITDKHHGKLQCSSVLGQGTEFLIQIPIQQKAD